MVKSLLTLNRCSHFTKCGQWFYHHFVKCKQWYYRHFVKCKQWYYCHFVKCNDFTNNINIIFYFHNFSNFQQCEYFEVGNVSIDFPHHSCFKILEITSLRLVISRIFKHSWCGNPDTHISSSQYSLIPTVVLRDIQQL